MIPLDLKKIRERRKDLLRTIKNVKRKKSSTNVVSDDPFDIFYNSYEEDQHDPLRDKTDVVLNESETKKSILNDEDFLSILTSSKDNSLDVKEDKKEYGIFERMKIYANEKIVNKEIKMYKFPFSMSIKYEESNIFQSLHKLFLISLKSIFKKYKKEKGNFYVKIASDILHFGDTLKITKGFEKILKNNDIKYIQVNDYLCVTGVDISVVVDYILNIKVDSFYVIPFILSEMPFENSIFYSVLLKKDNIVKENSRILFSYTLEGPFWMDDFKDFLSLRYKIL